MLDGQEILTEKHRTSPSFRVPRAGPEPYFRTPPRGKTFSPIMASTQFHSVRLNLGIIIFTGGINNLPFVKTLQEPEEKPPLGPHTLGENAGNSQKIPNYRSMETTRSPEQPLVAHTPPHGGQSPNPIVLRTREGPETLATRPHGIEHTPMNRTKLYSLKNRPP